MPNPEVSIEFDKIGVFYSGGELLSGRVLVRVDSPITVKGIHVWIKGMAKFLLAQKEIMENETILELVTTVYGSPPDKSNRPTSTLDKGEHTYAFCIRIPSTRPPSVAPLPSSVVGKYGEIRYFVKCHVERPGLHRATRIVRGFILSGSYNLKTDSTLRLPRELHIDHTLDDFCSCCWWWRGSGRIDAIFKTDKIGYECGESMRVWTQITNYCDRDIHNMQIALVKTIRYQAGVTHSSAVYQDETIVLAEIDRLELLKAKQTHVFSEKSIDVPYGLESTWSAGSCHIILVMYTIKVAGHVGTMRKFEMCAPVVIGNIPSKTKIDRSSEVIVA